jgi:hypothetical protein
MACTMSCHVGKDQAMTRHGPAGGRVLLWRHHVGAAAQEPGRESGGPNGEMAEVQTYGASRHRPQVRLLSRLCRLRVL